jgi:predicted RNA-binding Zn-ribbon protein involved in translation (DUF1610 family)
MKHICPKCGDEMFEPEPMMRLASNPMQKYIQCVSCDYLMTVAYEKEDDDG